MKYVIGLVFVFGSSLASAKKSNVNTVELKAGHHTILKMLNEDLGEPIAAPRRLTISVKCKGHKSFRQVALYRMCELESHFLEKDGSILHLKMTTARVDPHSGDVVCDQVDRQSLDVLKLCQSSRD